VPKRATGRYDGPPRVGRRSRPSSGTRCRPRLRPSSSTPAWPSGLAIVTPLTLRTSTASVPRSQPTPPRPESASSSPNSRFGDSTRQNAPKWWRGFAFPPRIAARRARRLGRPQSLKSPRNHASNGVTTPNRSLLGALITPYLRVEDRRSLADRPPTQGSKIDDRWHRCALITRRSTLPRAAHTP
jgi:hypothetical protein